MYSALQGLEPKLLWQHFGAISQIPRCSGNEKAVGDYIMKAAQRNNFDAKRDKIGNILVTIPASTGMEKRPTVILQGHTDMVCEKNNDTIHDFLNDPIKLLRKDDWITADGTTLGADNAIGFCCALAIMDNPSIPHPPMEFLFTVDEETGLTGASGLSSNFVSGKLMINLDSEEEGALYIGCAGGRHTILRKKIERIGLPAGFKTFKIKIGGLRGGHSGLEIHQDLGNAIKLTSRLLYHLKENVSFHLNSIDGGNKHNAIPREAEAIISLNPDAFPSLSDFIQDMEKIYQNEYQYVDPGIFIKLEEMEPVRQVMEDETQKEIIHFLYSVPHGVMAMSHAVPGLVETSTNLAIVTCRENQIEILTSQRSSVATAGIDIADKVKSLGELAGFQIEQGGSYPAWQPNPDSHLLNTAKNLYNELTGKKVEVKAVHAGLECGIIGEKYPGMDMISFGPTIQGAHSPDERVHIESVKNTWHFLLELLKRI